MHPILLNSNISTGGLNSVSLATNSGALIFYTTKDGTVYSVSKDITNYRGVNMSPPSTLGKCRQVVVGYRSAVALQTDGTVIGWGDDGNTNKTNTEYFMTQLNATGKKVVKLAAGAYHYLALLNDGSVVTWGSGNETAQFSDPNTVWTPVGLIPRPTAAEAPYITGYSAYINWEYKQDAASFLEFISSPTACVPNPEPISYRLFRGLNVGCPLHNGENYSSNNPNGAYDTPYIRTVGIYAGTYPRPPFAWSGILNWVNDTGAPYDYQFSRATVGDPTSVNYSGPGSSWTKSTAHITMPAGCYNNNCSSPNSIFGTSGKRYIDIAAGRGHSILLTEDGNIETWGQNWYYTITGSGKQGNGWSRAGSGIPNGFNSGDNAGWGAAYPFPPAPVGDQTSSTVKSFKTTTGSVKAVGAGYYTSQVIKSDGSIFAWDRNEWGESTPLRNSDGTLGLPTGPFKQVAGGYHHTAALRENGTVVCWGENNSGECNVPFGLNNCVQVIVGARYTAALRNDGYLFFWGKVDEFGTGYTPVTDVTRLKSSDLYTSINGPFEVPLLPPTSSTDYEVFSTDWGTDPLTNYGWGGVGYTLYGLVPSVDISTNVYNGLRPAGETNGQSFDLNSFKTKMALVPESRRVANLNMWWDDLAVMSLDKRNSYLNTTDATSYRGATFLTPWADKNNADFKSSLTSVLNKCKNENIAIPYFTDNKGLEYIGALYSLQGSFSYWDGGGQFDANGNPTHPIRKMGPLPEFQNVYPDARYYAAWINDSRFNGYTMSTSGKSVAKSMIDYYNLLSGSSTTATAETLYSKAKGVTAFNDFTYYGGFFEHPYSYYGPGPATTAAQRQDEQYKAQAWQAAFDELTNGNYILSTKNQVKNIVSYYANSLFSSYEVYPVDGIESKYYQDSNDQISVKPNYSATISGGKGFYGWYGNIIYPLNSGFPSSTPPNYVSGYVANPQTDLEKYNWQGHQNPLYVPTTGSTLVRYASTPVTNYAEWKSQVVYKQFVNDIKVIRLQYRTKPDFYNYHTPFVATKFDVPNYGTAPGITGPVCLYNNFYDDSRYFREFMYHVLLHGVLYVMNYWADKVTMNEIMNTWRTISNNSKSIPCSNSTGDVNLPVDRLNLNDAITNLVISGGRLTKSGRYLWRITVPPTAKKANNTIVLQRVNSTDGDLPPFITVDCTDPKNGYGAWVFRTISTPPKYVVSNDNMRAKAFIQAAIAGTDSVDILMSGDSNTNYTGWGWCDGLNYAMQQRGGKDYATPIVPAFSRGSANFYGVSSKFDSFSNINASEIVVNTSGTPALGGSLAKGTTANSSQLYTLLNRSSGIMQPNSAPFNYGYIPSGNWADFIGGIYLYENTNVLSWVSSALTYRVVHAVGPGMGTIKLSGRLDTSPFTSTGNISISCDSPSYAWTTSQLDISENAARTNGLYKFGYADTSAGSFNLTGPVAIAFQSVSRFVKGHAVQSMDHFGGATTKQVADNAVGGSKIITAYMKEARERQINSGGTGRVIVMFQGGINGTGSSTFATDCTTYMETCRACWISLGYPETDLGFIGLTSHQNNNPDTLTTIRTSAATLVNTYTIINGADLATYATLLTGSGGISYFENPITSRVHLTEAGYKYICNNLVTALLT